MSTVALQNLWETILGYNLSTANKRWLAEHLIEQVEAETKEQVEPYTMEEAREHRKAHMLEVLC